MGLLKKVRALIGALVHKPFTPGGEKANMGWAGTLAPTEAWPDRGQLGEGEPGVYDTGRVADLLERSQEAGDQG